VVTEPVSLERELQINQSIKQLFAYQKFIVYINEGKMHISKTLDWYHLVWKKYRQEIGSMATTY
jgi:hypothetical protein